MPSAHVDRHTFGRAGIRGLGPVVRCLGRKPKPSRAHRQPSAQPGTQAAEPSATPSHGAIGDTEPRSHRRRRVTEPSATPNRPARSGVELTTAATEHAVSYRTITVSYHEQDFSLRFIKATFGIAAKRRRATKQCRQAIAPKPQWIRRKQTHMVTRK